MIRKATLAVVLVVTATGLGGACIASAETPCACMHVNGSRHQEQARVSRRHPSAARHQKIARGIRVDGRRLQAKGRASQRYLATPAARQHEIASSARADRLRYQSKASVWLPRTRPAGDRSLAYGLIAGGALLTAAGAFLLITLRGQIASPFPRRRGGVRIITVTNSRRSILGVLAAVLVMAAAAQAASAASARMHIVARIRTNLVDGFAAGASSMWASDVQRTQLLRIDPRTNRVVARIPIGKPLAFVDDQDQVDGWLTVADGFVWATDQWHNRVVRVSPGSDRVVSSVRVPSPWDVTVSDGSVWVPEFERYGVARINERTNAVAKTLPAEGPTSVAAGAGSIWVVMHRADEVLRIDPTTNSVLATIPLRQASGPERAFFLFGSLWVNDGNEDNNAIFRIDPATNKVVAVIRPAGSFFGNNLVTDGRWIWAVSAIGRVYKIDPQSNRIVEQRSFATPGKCGPQLAPCFFSGAGYMDGTVWAYDVIKQEIIRIAG